MSIHESALDTPMRSQNSWIDSGRVAATAQPDEGRHARIVPALDQLPVWTSSCSLRLLVIV